VQLVDGCMDGLFDGQDALFGFMLELGLAQPPLRAAQYHP
jgi:hypothetical protein